MQRSKVMKIKKNFSHQDRECSRREKMIFILSGERNVNAKAQRFITKVFDPLSELIIHKFDYLVYLSVLSSTIKPK